MARLVVVMGLVVLLVVPAGAESKGKQCQKACAGVIAACTTRNRDLGDFARSCRSEVIRRCRREGLAICGVCGNGAIEEGEECDATNLNGETCVTRGFAGGTLRCAADCRLDVSQCFATRFVDNGDGTVTDNQTSLQWEKKVGGSGCRHCVSDAYTLSSTPLLLDGSAYSTFMVPFKGCGPGCPCFAGHCDWRLPTIDELLTIVDVHAPGCGLGTLPCIDRTFGPTEPGIYWSDTFAGSVPFPVVTFHLYVDFGLGTDTNTVDRQSTEAHFVRAVRGGG